MQPGARRDALVARLASGAWKVCVSAPPEGGRANEAVLDLVSRLLGVKRRQVRMARGASSRSKWVEVEGLSAESAQAKLAAALPGADGRRGAADEDGE